MNPNEREPIHSQELRGRMEEHHVLGEFLNKNFNEIGEEVEEGVEKFGDDELIEAVADYAVALERLSSHTESISWILALRKSGISDEDIIRIWDKRLESKEQANSDDVPIP